MATYTLRATYRGQRVDVIQALPGANWAIRLDGVPVSVSSQSLSDFRSERKPDLGPLFDTPQISTDEHGRHWDTSGREYVLVDVDGEATFEPADRLDEHAKAAAVADQRAAAVTR